jgi:FtsZ-binding cell division protein ZapB
MSDDVINTLVVNWKRGTLKAVPIIVPFDLMGINMLNDISVVCNCDVVSSLKGQIISAIKYTDIAYVDSIDVSNNKISITNKNNQQNVKLHIESLRNKRNELIDDIAHLYDERIKSLLGSMVIVNLSDDILYLRDRQRIDNVLRAFSQMLEFGIAELDSKEKILVSTVKTVNDYLPIIKNRLNELGVIIEN